MQTERQWKERSKTMICGHRPMDGTPSRAVRFRPARRRHSPTQGFNREGGGVL